MIDSTHDRRIVHIAMILALGAILSAPALAVEESDVLFFAPFEGKVEAAISRGDPAASTAGAQRFGEGVRGKAIAVDPQAVLSYMFKDNCIPDEGTVAMWVKPEWNSADEKFHHLFRASTGHFRGKSLNTIMVYEYIQGERLQFYTSNGQETSPQEGRSLAFVDPLSWKAGQWHHVAATWSATLASTEQVLYIDGRRAAAVSGAVFVPDTVPERMEIGGPRGTATTWFDDVMVFSRPLLPHEVAALYESSRQAAGGYPQALPFTSTRELQLRPYVLFGRSQLAVEVDCRGARGELAGRPGAVQLTLARGDRRWTASQAVDPQVGAARFHFAYDEIGGGPCLVQATLIGEDGKKLRTGSLSYPVPARPAWLGNQLGNSAGLLPPWTPIGVEGDTVRTWGRGYTFAEAPLPVQVASQGEDLLRGGGLGLSLRAAGEELSATTARSETFAGSEAEVRAAWTGSLGPLECRAERRLEFDGFLKIELELLPKKPCQVEALTLDIPLRGPAATLYHHANGTWTELSDAGGIGPAGWKKTLPFVPYVWIGNERAGLAWFCESDAGWHHGEERREIEIAKSEDGVDLRIRFIGKNTMLCDPLHLTFGFMATPVKPMPGGWRDWRPTFVSALNLDAFAKRGPRVAGCRNIGTLWNTHVGSFSYLPPDPAAMRAKVRLLKENGWETVLSYFALNYTQTGTPDFVPMEREWRRNPYSEAGYRDGSYGALCNASTWADMLLWAIDKTMDETGTDGVYLDCCNPNYCESGEHGCAPGRYPLLATRELMKRIYALVRKKRGPAGFVYAHNSENNLITTFSFTDAVLNGEQYNRKDLRTLTLEKFRAELSPQPYGVPAFLLPTLTKFQPGAKEKMAGAEFLAFPLLHDVPCTHGYLGRESRELLERIQAVMQRFGVAEAEFLPYWNHEAELAVSSPQTRVSAYLRKDGKAALLIAAAEQPTDAALTLRGRLAPLRAAAARDPLGGETLRWSGSSLVWPLDRRVRLAIIGAGEVDKQP